MEGAVMKPSYVIAIVVGFMVSQLVTVGLVVYLRPASTPAVVIPVDTPADVSPAYTASLATFKAKLASDPVKAGKLAAFYQAFADVVAGDPSGRLTNTAIFREAHAGALDALQLKGEPTVGVEIDAVLATGLGGLEPKEIDQAGREKIAGILRDLSRVAGGT